MELRHEDERAAVRATRREFLKQAGALTLAAAAGTMWPLGGGSVAHANDDENKEFVKDPFKYISTKTNPVDVMQTPGYIYGDTLRMTARQKADLTHLLREFMDSIGLIRIDLMPIESESDKWIGLRPCLKHLIPIPKVKAKWPSVETIPESPKTGIDGYYFPYKTDKITKDVDATLGFVDFPRESPEHDFVFTGSMNGCELVITESPKGDKFYRVYHYQNAASHKGFRHKKWPGPKILYWLNFEDYGSDKDDEMVGWNFLHYAKKDKKWLLLSQPLKTKTKWIGEPMAEGSQMVWVPVLSKTRKPLQIDFAGVGYQPPTD